MFTERNEISTCFSGKMHRSTSELDLNRYDLNHHSAKDDKKREDVLHLSMKAICYFVNLFICNIT